MFFFSFIFFLIGLLSFLYSPFLLLLSFLPFSYLYFYRKVRIAFLGFLISIGIFLLFLLLPKEGDVKSLTGIIISKKENYYLLLTWKGKFYVSEKNNPYTLFSIISLKGNSSSLSFTHYESVFNFKDYLKTQGVFYEFKADQTEVLFSNPISNQSLKNYIFLYTDEKTKIFLSSLLCGDSLSSLEENESFLELGVLSAFSLSGFHLSFFFQFIEKRLKDHQKEYFIYLELLLLLFFLFLSDYKYSLRRIFLLKCLSLFSKKTSFKLPYIEKISLVAMILLLFEPYSLLSSSFYCSFPLLFILALFPEKKTVNLKNRISSFLFIFLFYLPLRMFQNPSFHFLSPILQIILLPMSHFLFLSSFSLLLVPQIGYLFNMIVKGILYSSNFLSSVPFSLCFGKPNHFFLVFYYSLLIFSLIFGQYTFQKFRQKTIIASLLLFSVQFLPDITNHYQVAFIDVGQGDSTLIRYRRKNILIDTGGNKYIDIGKDCIYPFLQKKKIDHLDSVIITHTDFDHSGALKSLQNIISIKNIFYAEDFLMQKDNTLTFDSLKIQNLNIYSNKSEDNNYRSGVYLFHIKNTSFMIMGDAPKEIEKMIIKDNPDLSCDILKVGHHGSNTSSDPYFLKTINPKLAIISCGEKNNYKHPHKETIDSLKNLNIPYRRTDEEGSITLTL